VPRRDELPRSDQPRHVYGRAEGHIELLDVYAGMRPSCQTVKEHAVLEWGERIGVLTFYNGGHRVILSVPGRQQPTQGAVR
jgi:hypothetical protein